MSTTDLVTCGVCGVATYATKAGAVRKHDAKPDGVPRYARPVCPGSGQPGTPVERTVGR